ncbi:MAG TPA: T9SS type A sorting domain-containing protein [Saprospiraceae bacterium]|nr:T9SS type A sorting domain-containing protein [Saprospiraceae bacterium]
MQLRLLFSLIILIAFEATFAQPCDPDGSGFRLTNQFSVQLFNQFYPNCDIIQGDLVIGHSVRNLSGLSQIKRIDGNLLIRDTSMGNQMNQDLISLDGLHHLESVGGDIHIDGIERLVDLSGLTSLETIGGAFYVTNNTSLKNLDGLTNLDTIYGNLVISRNPSLLHLNGLNTVDQLLGDIEITYNHLTQDLSGLENLEKVNGHFIIQGNFIDSLKGLEKLQTVEKDLIIASNPSLTIIGRVAGNYEMGPVKLSRVGGTLSINNNSKLINVSGLNGLEEIGSDFELKYNSSLNELSHLRGLNKLNGNLEVYRNPNLLDLDGLNNIDEIGGIHIKGNQSMNSLHGLHNVDIVRGNFEIGENLPNLEIISGGELSNDVLRLLAVDSIMGNLNLSTNAWSFYGFSNLKYIGGALTISRNTNLSHITFAFESLEHIEGTLSFSYNTELTEARFKNLRQIGGLQFDTNYELTDCYFPALENIGAYGLKIWENKHLTSFANGFPELEQILGDVSLYDTEVIDLSGFQKLKLIDGQLVIDKNENLSSLSGLENLEYINGNLIIYNSGALADMNLEILEAINGALYISGNHSLSSLSGLENIDPSSISDISVGFNESLSDCAVRSICDYLVGGGPGSFGRNDVGCNTTQEVLEACATVYNNETGQLKIFIGPNPVSDFIQMKGDFQGNISIVVLNSLGQVILSQDQIRQNERIDLTGIPSGSYFLQIQSQGTIQTSKFMIK